MFLRSFKVGKTCEAYGIKLQHFPNGIYSLYQAYSRYLEKEGKKNLEMGGYKIFDYLSL